MSGKLVTFGPFRGLETRHAGTSRRLRQGFPESFGGARPRARFFQKNRVAQFFKLYKICVLLREHWLRSELAYPDVNLNCSKKLGGANVSFSINIFVSTSAALWR